MIITIGGIKGGTGKTTIATSFAVIAANEQHEVLFVDADDQETATDFVDVRKEDHPHAVRFTSIRLRGRNVRSEVLELVPKFKHVIIDTGGRDTTSLRAALSVSDMVLIPFAPRSFDVWTTVKVAVLIEEMRTVNPKLKAFACLNRADPHGQGTENVLAPRSIATASDGVLQCLDALVVDRKAFAHAASQGLCVTELVGEQRNPKASQEILALYSRCFEGDDHDDSSKAEPIGSHHG